MTIRKKKCFTYQNATTQQPNAIKNTYMKNLDEVTNIPPVYKIISTRIMIIANSNIVVMSQEIISADLTKPMVRISVMFPDSFIQIR